MTIKPFVIVCLGDSITCNWDSPSYVDYWQELLDQKYGPGKVKAISAGVNGETAQDGYYRLQTDVLPHHPDLVTIMFGHNDLRYKVKPLLYQKYLAKIINRLKHDLNSQIWLLTPNQVLGQENQTLYLPYLVAIKTVAQEKQVKAIDTWSAFNQQDLKTIYPWDYLHPNETGHRLIAKYLMNHSNHLAI